MRIAQVSPLFESVPPSLYGGTERVVSYLTDELVRRGHDVVLFASGDSQTSAELVPVCERSLRLFPNCGDPLLYHFIMMEKVLKQHRRFDIIHSHVECIGFILGRRSYAPVISTLHGRLDLPEHKMMFHEYSECPLVAISNAQKSFLPDATWRATVYHGLPRDLYRFNEKGGNYLAFIGRISPEKKIDSAIAIADMCGIPLKIAAKVDNADKEYFDKIKHLLKNPLVEFLGEVKDSEKNELLGSAMAFLHPVDWPEPFGIAMIEAMACGTPVIARRRGSIPEVVDHEVSGYIFETDEEAADYVGKLVPSLSRKGVREQFERRFSQERMVSEYLKVYEAELNGGK